MIQGHRRGNESAHWPAYGIQIGELTRDLFLTEPGLFFGSQASRRERIS